MQRILAILVLACALVAVHGRELQQVKYKTVGDALVAKENSELSTLLAAVKAAGITVPADAAYTIFAPTNKAFESADIKKATGLTAAQLLEPKNKEALTQVLQFHIVPAAAVRSTQLKATQEVPTALKGASLIVEKKGAKVEVYPGDKKAAPANVVAADVAAGNSVIHVIDKVLIPPKKN